MKTSLLDIESLNKDEQQQRISIYNNKIKDSLEYKLSLSTINGLVASIYRPLRLYLIQEEESKLQAVIISCLFFAFMNIIIQRLYEHKILMKDIIKNSEEYDSINKICNEVINGSLTILPAIMLSDLSDKTLLKTIDNQYIKTSIQGFIFNTSWLATYNITKQDLSDINKYFIPQNTFFKNFTINNKTLSSLINIFANTMAMMCCYYTQENIYSKNDNNLEYTLKSLTVGGIFSLTYTVISEICNNLINKGLQNHQL